MIVVQDELMEEGLESEVTANKQTLRLCSISSNLLIRLRVKENFGFGATSTTP